MALGAGRCGGAADRKVRYAPRIQDAGLDPNLLPGCTVKNWRALEDVLDSHLPKMQASTDLPAVCSAPPAAAGGAFCTVQLYSFFQHIFPAAQADLFCLLQGGLPLDVGVGVLEVIVVAAPARLCQVLSQLAVGQQGSGQAGIGAGLVQRYRVKRGKHTDIRQDGCVILPVAVAVGADILHQADMEAGAACTDSGGILCHLAVQLLIGAVVQGVDGVKVARTDAAAAALALVVIDHSLIVLVVGDGVRAALR